MLADNVLIVLIAPNISEQMGGEAIKALQIYRALKKLHPRIIQITHERNQAELEGRLGLRDCYFIEDACWMRFLWWSVCLRWMLDPLFLWVAVRFAERLAGTLGISLDNVVIHQVEPNSPVVPRTVSKYARNVFGPVNGNIYYPEIFRCNETVAAKLRRVLHFPLQAINRRLPGGIANAELVLCAGGCRTIDSLVAAGCNKRQLVESLDCGVDDSFFDRPRVEHRDVNFRFIHFGRLVFHKGTALIIRSLAKTRNPICLDIVGYGPELESCQKLVSSLGLQERVRFLGWHQCREDLFNTFQEYRGMLLPSIEDANGIVVQEAMALGLPPICLDWGGPQLLIEDFVTGFLIKPISIEYIVNMMAERLDWLAEDYAMAERMSITGRKNAEEWKWSKVASTWLREYP